MKTNTRKSVLLGFLFCGMVLNVLFQNCSRTQFNSTVTITDNASLPQNSEDPAAPPEDQSAPPVVSSAILGMQIPVAVVANAAGNYIYVVEQNANRIARCSTAVGGACVYFDGSNPAAGITSIWYPNNITLDASGENFYFTDGHGVSIPDTYTLTITHNRVVKCPVTVFNSPSVGVCHQFGQRGNSIAFPAGYFSHPMGLKVAANGDVYIADSNMGNARGRMQKCPATVFAVPSTGNCTAYQPPVEIGNYIYDVALNESAGVFYIATSPYNAKIAVCPLSVLNSPSTGSCSALGTHVETPTQNQGEYNWSYSMVRDSHGYLYFSDLTSNSIQKCTANLSHCSVYIDGTNAQATNLVYGMAVGQDGTIYTANGPYNKVNIIPHTVFPDTL